MTPLTETGWLGPSGALLAAPAIGFAFGWFLERGGLGSAPKLAGQFYLTDLTVFKVMFSALVTAMLGRVLARSAGRAPARSRLPAGNVRASAGDRRRGVWRRVSGRRPVSGHVVRGRGDRKARRRSGSIAGMLLGVLAVQPGVRLDCAALLRDTAGAVRLTDLIGMRTGRRRRRRDAMALAGFVVAGRIERGRA